MSVKFSTFHLVRWDQVRSFRETYAYHLEYIRYAEELGFHGVWPAEHHFRPYGVVPGILQFCAYIAAVTKRIRIGTAVVVVPFYHPLRLAEEVAQLDILSGGRLDLGLGRGYQAVEFEGLRVPMVESRERFQEALDIMRRAWTKGVFSYDGRFTKVEGVNVLPKPEQKPHPPIWAAATSPDTADVMGAQGIPIISAPVQNYEQAADVVQRWRKAASSAGHDPGKELIALRQVYVADSDDEAYADLASLPPMDSDTGSAPIDRAGQWVPGYEFYRDVGWKQRTQQKDPRSNPQLLIGSPETVARKVEGQIKAGYTHIIGTMDASGRMPLKKLRKSMELIANRVVPEFRIAAKR